MSYESDKCPTCGSHSLNSRLECDNCDEVIGDKAPRWSIGSTCPDDDGSEACSAECCLALVERMYWDGLHGVEVTFHAGKRENAIAALRKIVMGENGRAR